MNLVIEFLSLPLVDATIHLFIAGIFVMEVTQHWTHHRRNKQRREEPRYTLDEARVILFEEALTK